MSDQRNLIVAIVVSLAILLGFQFLYEAPRQKEKQARQQAIEETMPKPGTAAPGVAAGGPSLGATAPGAPQPQAGQAGSALPTPATAASEVRAAAVEASPRIRIESPRLEGSLSLIGGRIDDLTLRTYRQTPAPDSPKIVLLSPPGVAQPYYAEFGWTAASGESVKVPQGDTPWTLAGQPGRTLTPSTPLTLNWDNGAGVVFERVIAIDETYMFTVTDRIINRSGQPIAVHPYGLLTRSGTPHTEGFYILHEGPLGVFNETLSEYSYSDLTDSGRIERQSNGGWIGFTDKYWLAALVPDQGKAVGTSLNHRIALGTDRYQVDYIGGAMAVPAGGTVEATNRLFAGAKEVDLLDGYRDKLGVAGFDKAIDFGWFYFLTKPLFYLLQYFNHLLGNFGLAILLLTVIVKVFFFPLANKSYKALSSLKKLQPEMLKLRERFGEDRQRLNQEMMALYKREKANPLAGCLPIAVQIPVFFALYKVMFVTIEMRHAPFYGWIKDLSAPDPTTIFNLFGLIPWDPPSFLMIGVWPLIMGVSMFLQQKLNPAPPDPVQAKIFMLLPIFFTFLLASFPAGLVIYWTWNNVLSIAQQWVIMRRAGIKNPAA